MTTSDTCFVRQSSVDSVVINRTPDTEPVTPPAAPLVSGLKAGYCSNAGVQVATVTNMPAASGGVMVKAKVDNGVVAVGTDGRISLSVSSLSVGTHTLSVVFANSAGADTATASFLIYASTTPVVHVSSNSTAVNGPSQQVTLSASAVLGGGSAPLYTFAKDAGFSAIVQAESPVNTITLNGSSLAMGNNLFFVRMKSSDSCSTAQYAVDSIVIVHNAGSGGLVDMDHPDQIINVGPNPFVRKITITGLQPDKSYGISLVNRDGKEMIFLHVKGQQQSDLTTGDLNQGIYYLRVYDESSHRVIGSVVLLSAPH